MRDRKGAITVIGLFAVLFLAGALWYVIGIANAVLYRERVQDAADAVAFAGAVYHARGMNIIVTLNILMAALLGLVVAARLLRFLNDTANVIGCGCSPVPFIGPTCINVCSFTFRARQPLANLETRLTNLYNRVGPTLSKTQVGVARAMPWIAEVKAVGVSLNYAPDVRFGAIASFSLVPLPSDDRLGLPVQEGDDKVLCGKVSSGLVDLALAPVSHVPGSGLIRHWLESPLNRFVSNFCNGGELIDEHEAEEIEQREEDSQVDQRCDWEAQVSHALAEPWQPLAMMKLAQARADHAEGKADLRKLQCYSVQKNALLANLPEFGAYQNRSVPPDVRQVPNVGDLLRTRPGDPPPQQSLGCAFSRHTCEERAHADIRAERERNQGENTESTEIDAESRRQTTPKIVFSPAKNGDAYFQVWSIVSGDDSRATKPARGVEIAAHGRERASDTSVWARLGWAQAEFYYDHEGAWSDAVDDAMWNLRWRARLRRVRPPTINILENWAGTLLPKIEGRIASALGIPDSPHTVLDLLVRMEFDRASDEIEQRVNDLAVQGDNAIERRAREAWRHLGGIH